MNSPLSIDTAWHPLANGCPPEWASGWGQDRYGVFVEFTLQEITQRLRWIPPGEFQMGSPVSEAERSDDEILHRVVLTRGFWLADTACTQALWQAVMGENPSHFKGAEQPVETVSWNDAQIFLDRLNEIVPEGGFRLPTEAEWEYACRAGTKTPFWFGETITPEQVNYNGNHPYADGAKGQNREETVEVKELPCNGWGLYQMYGNVWEWCKDWYGGYSKESQRDPSGPETGSHRVIRGGSWNNDADNCRSAYRNNDDPGNRNTNLGVRLASTSHPPDGGRLRMAALCIRLVQPCRACAGIRRTKRTKSPASGSDSEGRRGFPHDGKGMDSRPVASAP